MSIKIIFVWYVTTHGIEEQHKCFGGPCCFYLHAKIHYPKNGGSRFPLNVDS